MEGKRAAPRLVGLDPAGPGGVSISTPAPAPTSKAARKRSRRNKNKRLFQQVMEAVSTCSPAATAAGPAPGERALGQDDYLNMDEVAEHLYSCPTPAHYCTPGQYSRKLNIHELIHRLAGLAEEGAAAAAAAASPR